MVKVCLFYGVDLRGKTMANASRRGGTFPCWRRSIWRGQICRGGARRLHQCWIFFPVAWRSRQIAGRIAGRLLQHRSSGRTLPVPRSTGPPSTSTSPTSTTKTATTSTTDVPFWMQITENVYKELEPSTKKLRFSLPYLLLAFPVYLWYRSPGKNGSHFNPISDLFTPNERRDVIISTTCWFTVIALLIAMACVFGPMPVLKLYVVPYAVFVMWLDLVTYLHHHGHQGLPLYRGELTGAEGGRHHISPGSVLRVCAVVPSPIRVCWTCDFKRSGDRIFICGFAAIRVSN